MNEYEAVIKAIKRLEKVIKAHEANVKNWNKVRYLEIKSTRMRPNTSSVDIDDGNDEELEEKIPA